MRRGVPDPSRLRRQSRVRPLERRGLPRVPQAHLLRPARPAGTYRQATRERIARTAEKNLDTLDNLIKCHHDDRAIIFTANNDFAYDISRELIIPCITHQTKTDERTEILDRFRSGEYSMLVTSQVLDEGIDVPEPLVEPLRPLALLAELHSLVPLPGALYLLPLPVAQGITPTVGVPPDLRAQALVCPQLVHRLDALVSVSNQAQVVQRRTQVDPLVGDDQPTVRAERLLVFGDHLPLAFRTGGSPRRLVFDRRLVSAFFSSCTLYVPNRLFPQVVTRHCSSPKALTTAPDTATPNRGFLDVTTDRARQHGGTQPAPRADPPGTSDAEGGSGERGGPLRTHQFSRSRHSATQLSSWRTQKGRGRLGLGLAVVAVRVAYDLVELRHPRWVESAVFSDETIGDERSVETPDGEPVASFESDRRGTLVASVIGGVLASVLGMMLFPVLVGGFVGLVVGGGVLATPSGPVVGAAVGVTVVVGVRVLVELVVGWVVTAHVVYHVYPDAVVAYNELTNAPQWVARRDEITEVTPSSDLFAGVLPEWYDTVKITTAGGESHTLGYFGDVESAARLLDDHPTA